MKTPDNYLDAVKMLQKDHLLEFDLSFRIAHLCSRLLATPQTEFEGRDLVIRVLDAWERIDSGTHELWNDLVAAAGLYPYVNSEKLSPSGQLRYETHASPFLKDVYLTEGQFELSALLAKSRSLIVSAPTSFGKSLLIEEVVASKRHKNIVIIQPTLALLDETRKKLQKYRDSYNLVVSTFQKPVLGPNIFIFTGERVVEYPNFPPIDFFVIDEFYKLSLARDDERAATLNCALYRLLKFTNNFYMLGPHIKESPRGIPKELNAFWRKTDFATVAVNRHPIEIEATKKREWFEEARPKLNHLLSRIEGSTLVYCQSPSRAVLLVGAFTESAQTQAAPSADVLSIIQWVRENIHDKWQLIEALQKGAAYHHGALPRHLGSALVDAFNNRAITRLFCTSTLIEGVNTAAKNVVLFDRLKGRKAIDYFDHRNIMGRTGRMGVHFIGNVYEFHTQPEQIELEVEVPLFTQDNAPTELLIQLDDIDVQESARARLREFHKLSTEVQILIKANKGLPVEGQIEILNILGRDAKKLHPLMAWTGIPNYHQLFEVLNLAWKYLLKPGESKGGARSPGNLSVLTLQYCASKSIAGLIRQTVGSDYWIRMEPDEKRRIDMAVNMVLQVSRHWFEYKLPKFLSAVSYLQKHVFEEKGLRPGNYLFLAQHIENNFLPANLAALLEYDVPASALRKISRMISDDMTPDEVLARIRKMEFDTTKLLPYEEQKLRSIGG